MPYILKVDLYHTDEDITDEDVYQDGISDNDRLLETLVQVFEDLEIASSEFSGRVPA